MDTYSGHTTEQLLALHGVYRTDSIVLALEAAIAEKAARLGMDWLTGAERTVLAIEALEREVNSDGFLGLFTNAPEHVPYIVPSLRAIQRPAVAKLTQQAIRALKTSGPLTPKGIAAAILEDDEDRGERLHEIDNAYYASAGDLAEPLFAFIAANRHDIRLP